MTERWEIVMLTCQNVVGGSRIDLWPLRELGLIVKLVIITDEMVMG